MKKSIIIIAFFWCLSLFCPMSYAQDILAMTPEQFKEAVIQGDGTVFYDDLGITMAIGQEGDIRNLLKSSGSSDKVIYDNLQTCQRLFKGVDCIPQYVAEYFVANYPQYAQYYTKTLSKTGDVNDAAAAFLLLTGFNGKCNSANKSFTKFCSLCDNFSVEAANSIASDKGNCYRGVTLVLMSAQIFNKIKDGTISEISDKVKKSLVKTYDGVVKECDKALKKDNQNYNQYVSQYKEMYEYVLNSLQ